MGNSMAKPTFHVDQLITSTDASKRFGELRKKAQREPQYITDNGNVETVLIGYPLFEELYERLSQLEQQEEERILLQRIERLDGNPEKSKSWKTVRREPQ
ncbi:type II toxin-antitoxin system Phd/YefM family antitoxin [Paenibacillus mesophilus]|nr:type II toxin-antitoxin system Phd/YefM family antitoxin [Paenibacillus mesophilus]